MVLLHENIFLVLQLDLGFQNYQENTISSLNTFVGRNRRNAEHYKNASQILEEEESKVEALERVVQRRDVRRVER